MVDTQDDLAVEKSARNLGLLKVFNFSGVRVRSIDRRSAQLELMAKTRSRAFDLLRKEFGAVARFWPNFVYLSEHADFYWRRAGLGLIITGPRNSDRHPADTGFRTWGRTRIEKLLRVPYYTVWHRPKKFLDAVRAELALSGKYPRLKSS